MGDTLLRRTGQLWKLYFGVGALPFSGLAVFFGALSKPRDAVSSSATVLLFLAGLALAVGGWVFAACSITCPNCRTRLLWKAVTEKRTHAWYAWITRLERCPVCEKA
jgi:hypothetical protein